MNNLVTCLQMGKRQRQHKTSAETGAFWKNSATKATQPPIAVRLARLDFKLLCGALSIAIVLTSVSGQVWNSIHGWHFSEDGQLIWPDMRAQFLVESAVILAIHGVLMGSFALITEHMRQEPDYNPDEQRKTIVWLGIQAFTIALLFLIGISRIKLPDYLSSTL